MSIEGKVVDAVPGPPDDAAGAAAGDRADPRAPRPDGRGAGGQGRREGAGAGRGGPASIGRLKAKVIEARQQAAARAPSAPAVRWPHTDRTGPVAGQVAGSGGGHLGRLRPPSRSGRRLGNAADDCQVGGGRRCWRRHRRGRRGPGRMAALPALEAARMKLLNKGDRAAGRHPRRDAGAVRRSRSCGRPSPVRTRRPRPPTPAAAGGRSCSRRRCRAPSSRSCRPPSTAPRPRAPPSSTGEWPGDGADEQERPAVGRGRQQSDHGQSIELRSSDHGAVEVALRACHPGQPRRLPRPSPASRAGAERLNASG